MSWSIESVHEAALTPSQIFRFYTDPSTWGSWGHNTRYEVAPSPAGVRIRHAIGVDGKVAGLTRLLQFPRLYRRLLDREIRRLVSLAGREVH